MWKKVRNYIQHHGGKGQKAAIFILAGALTGAASVMFMWAFEFVLHHPLSIYISGYLRWITVPVLFILSVELIRRTAPFSDGAGIPQTIFAASQMNETSIRRIYPLVSIRTMAVKIAALLIAVWAGASTGREGPTVHVAACLFLGFVLLMRRFFGIKLNLRSAIVAGGAAGLAAAFNTPLAGVTFAIEELSGDTFLNIKEAVLMAIIVAGIAAKSLTGEYNYFGHLDSPSAVALGTVILIGFAGGIFGALFSTILVKGRRVTASFQTGFWRYAIPGFFSLFILFINKVSFFEVLGPGNIAAQSFVTRGFIFQAASFPVLKLAATVLTYWSGIAGGIFAPSLSIGSGLGADIGYWTGQSSTACAVLGMASFLAGTIQAPMTAFVIIFEMTGHHQMLLPVMLASLISVITARIFGAKHLYQELAKIYIDKIEPDPLHPSNVHIQH